MLGVALARNPHVLLAKRDMLSLCLQGRSRQAKATAASIRKSGARYRTSCQGHVSSHKIGPSTVAVS